jgi:osmoprotectant transport system permease protein
MTDEPLIRWDWIVRELDEIGRRAADHILLTVLAVGIGFVISFALAVAIRRRPVLHGPILGVAGVLYAIPSLALFALLIPFTGVQSLLTAEIPLVSYTILILVRNIVTGFAGVPRDVLEAADGMGYTPWQRLWRVELPIALPVIVAGLRIATVTTIGLVTVTAIIAEGGLGSLILQGLRRLDLTPVVVGSGLSFLLALVADATLLATQRLLTPWSRERQAGAT